MSENNFNFWLDGQPVATVDDSQDFDYWLDGQPQINTPDQNFVTGTGALTLGAISSSGSGLAAHDATGSLNLPAITVDGSAIAAHDGSGSLNLAAITVDGSGTVTFDQDGTGDLALPALQASGSGTVTFDQDGTGSLLLGAISVSGSGTRADHDFVSPMVTNVTSPHANGTFTNGELIPITISFDETVYVGGIPQVLLELGTTDRLVDYVSGSGTNTLTFNYTANGADNTNDLSYVSVNSLILNGGSIQDLAGNDADLMLPIPGAAGSLSFNKDIGITQETATQPRAHNRNLGKLR